MIEAIAEIATWAARGALALLLLASALHKWKDLPEFARTVSAYELLPPAAAPWAARVVPALELSASVLLLIPALGSAGGVLAFGLLSIYTGALSLQLLRGREGIDCGCGGFGAQQSIHGGLLVRNAILLLAALLCGLANAAGLGVGALSLGAAWTAGAAALLLALLYAATDQLMANSVHRTNRASGRMADA